MIEGKNIIGVNIFMFLPGEMLLSWLRHYSNQQAQSKGKEGVFHSLHPKFKPVPEAIFFLCGRDVAEIKVIYFSNIFISSTTKTFPIGFNCFLQK